MKVTTLNVEEFLFCLNDVQEVFEDTVRVSLSREAYNEVKFEVSLKAAAIVFVDAEHYLLETEVYCGADYDDHTQDKTGTIEALRLRDLLETYAKAREWKCRPGAITL